MQLSYGKIQRNTGYARIVWMRPLSAAFLLIFSSQSSSSEFDTEFSRELMISDYGGVGVLQTPSGRFMEDGFMTIGLSSSSPHNKGFATIQLFPWLQTTIRYSEVTDKKYGTFTDQTYKDRGIDFKLRLSEETRNFPALALGVRDIGGTGIFGSEYLVGTKEYKSFDISLGLGWGQLGSKGYLDNPLTYLSNRFEQRNANTNLGGRPGLSNWFSGEGIALFGSVVWKTPIDGLRLAVELDGNNYQNDFAEADLTPSLPFNFGVAYRISDNFDLTIGYERGEQLLLAINTKFDLHNMIGLPDLSNRPKRLSVREVAKKYDGVGPYDPENLPKALEKTGLDVKGIRDKGGRLIIHVEQGRFRYYARAIGRSMRNIDPLLGDGIASVSFVFSEGGLAINEVEIIREHFRDMDTLKTSTDELYQSSRFSDISETEIEHSTSLNNEFNPGFSWGASPKLRQHIGGPDNFYFWQLWLAIGSRVNVTNNLSLNTILGLDIVNNLDDLTWPSDSKLPHVRSDIKDYLTEGETGISRLAVDYSSTLRPGLFTTLSAGILEDMYGGFSGEVLYWPYRSRLALGAELARVRKRAFDKRLRFLDYEVTTGHLNAYYEMPWYDLLAKVSVGRYLAGDVGTTIDISRTFGSGMVIGAFASFTNVSAEQFGEGSFDKGFYISIPMEMLRVTPEKGRAGFMWRPLTRDGGQKVYASRPLYSSVSIGRQSNMDEGWDRIFEW